MIINIVLIITLIAMFQIAKNSESPNILNYEKVITDRYASWEQNLTDREKAVREKERELGITVTDNNGTETDTAAETAEEESSGTEASKTN